MKRILSAILVVAMFFYCWVLGEGQEPYQPRVLGPSDEGTKAIQRIRVPEGMKVSLWAAEPHLANPVAFCIDEKGRIYVAETFRLHRGVTDNRSHTYWISDDLASRTVADRLAMYRKHLGKKFASYGVDHDRVRLIEDRAGTGKADHSSVFADGFKNPADGLGSGLLARGGNVYYTCIPDLWLLKDTKGTGTADVKKSLHTGYGVHVAFIGHDLHGLRFGPDGKLYFSIGDRGLHVESGGRTLANPDSGAVLRCNPDGSDLEIVATGLRNPQELAFDQYGNLFTGDNNADGGDSARWVYIVEGGDSGWRIGYQYMKGLGTWNSEKHWHLQHDTQAAYLLPPLAHITSGPSGLTYHPGTGLLPDKYKDHFFLCDFRGNNGNSGIHAFTLKPKGAAFEVVNRQQFVWSILATDCDFAPDGALYISDWVEGWGLTGKGRIYKVFDPARLKDPTTAEVKKLFGEGFGQRSEKELARLLRHADQRVRQEAQFALVERKAWRTLAGAVVEDGLAGLHAVWGLGQFLSRKTGWTEEERRLKQQIIQDLSELISGFEEVGTDELRAQALKVLSATPEIGKALGPRVVIGGLKKSSPRVQFFAAMTAGKLGKTELTGPLFDLARRNADKDPYIRHAVVMGLAGIKDRNALEAASKDASPSVRLAAVLAMRRLAMPEVARFLNDVDPRVATEAARAIYELPILEAMPQLAAMIDRLPAASAHFQPFVLRVLNANFRLGKKENAVALASFAGRSGVPESLRLEALAQLGDWAKPSGRDRVNGLWRALSPRPQEDAAEALRPALASIMTASDKIRTEGAALAARLGIKEIGPALRALVADRKRPAAVRIESLKALAKLKDQKLLDLARDSLRDEDPRLRHQARAILVSRQSPEEAVRELTRALGGAMVERQGALGLLADLKTKDADLALANAMDELLSGKAPAESHLDILDAVRRRNTPDLKKRLERFEAGRDPKDHLARFRETLHGGDPEVGRRLFFDKAEVSCLRCHKVKGTGGDVGPDLTGIGKRYKRDYLLEAMVDPNRQIAKGYETVLLVLKDGATKSGILKAETPKELQLMTAEGHLVSIPRVDIDERLRGKSAMPDDLMKHFSLRELRDLIEFLAELKEGPAK